MRDIWIRILFISFSCSLSAIAVAADQNVVSKSIQSQSFDERFSLVGVIAEGDGRGKGIAVIKDHKQNKTHTLRIGEAVPGQTDLVLTRVSRQVAVLHGTLADVFVGTDSGAARDSAVKESDGESSGLFDKWYQNRAPAVFPPVAEAKTSTDVPSPIRTKNFERKVDALEDVEADDHSNMELDSDDDPFESNSSAPTRVEYSDEMRALIDKYLNGETPVTQ